MEPVRIGASLPPLPEAEPVATPVVKPSDSVALAPSAPATGNKANVFQPDVSDEVLVGFAQGDPRAPYVTGGLWNGETPPTDASSAPGSTSDPSSGERARLLEHQLKKLK
jgi:hypothetical protein